MVRFFGVVIGAALLALLLGLAVFKVELPLLVTLGMGSVCLAWLGPGSSARAWGTRSPGCSC